MTSEPERLDWTAVSDVDLERPVHPSELTYLPASPADEERFLAALPPMPDDIDTETHVRLRPLRVTLGQWKRLRAIAEAQGFDEPTALLQSLLDEVVDRLINDDQADQENPASDGDA